MKSLASAILLAVCSLGLRAADPAVPELPKPQKEHEWLARFVGEWESEAEIHAEPGKPPMKAKGTEKIRSLGGFWIVSEGASDLGGGFKMDSVLTVGYDPAKKKYTGTWIDSFSNYLWKYEGAVDEKGRTLTLETEGPCPCLGPGKTAKFQESTEFLSKDHKVFTARYQGDDGKWVLLMKVDAKRKK